MKTGDSIADGVGTGAVRLTAVSAKQHLPGAVSGVSSKSGQAAASEAVKAVP